MGPGEDFPYMTRIVQQEQRGRKRVVEKFNCEGRIRV